MTKINDVIRYDLIVQNAMLGVVKQVLSLAQKEGLPSDHHFYLTYHTTYEGVVMPAHLLEKYPDEITIVLQHEFEDLQVTEVGFSVTLWFNNVPAYLTVPFKAIRAFFDPSVKFGLQFSAIESDESLDDKSAEITALPVKIEDKDSDEKPAKKAKASKPDKAEKNDKTNIVSLDSFRKK